MLLVLAPELSIAIMVGLLAFGIGALAHLRLSFPLLGFLVVFDSVFSLGTQIREVEIEVIGVSLSNPLLLGLAARLLVSAALQRARLNREAIWISGLMSFAVVASAVFSETGFTRSVATYLGPGIVVLVLFSYGTPTLLRRLLAGIAVGTVLAAASGLVGIVTGDVNTPFLGRAIGLIGTNPIPVPRVSGLYQNPNALAFTLVAGFFAIHIVVSRVWAKWVISMLVLLALVFTYGRGPLAGMLLGVIAYSVLRYARRRNLLFHRQFARGWGLFYGGLTLGAALVIALGTYLQASPLFSVFWNEASVDFRLEIFAGALKTWMGSPLLGIGPGEFLSRYAVEGHNTFLQAGAELGIVGFLPVVWVFVLALTRSARRALVAPNQSARAEAWLCGGVVAIGVVASILTLIGVKEMWAILAAGAMQGYRQPHARHGESLSG